MSFRGGGGVKKEKMFQRRDGRCWEVCEIFVQYRRQIFGLNFLNEGRCCFLSFFLQIGGLEKMVRGTGQGSEIFSAGKGKAV